MYDLHQATVEKINYLKDHGFNVVEVWECDIKRELDEEMKRYFDNYDMVDPLEPRDAFFGGRTNAAKLFHECKEGENIRYAHRCNKTNCNKTNENKNLTFLSFLTDTSISPPSILGVTR